MTQSECLRRAGLFGIREPYESAAPTNLVMEDDCCSPRLVRALKTLTGDSWTCPKCGCNWTARTDTDLSIRRWTPDLEMEVIRL